MKQIKPLGFFILSCIISCTSNEHKKINSPTTENTHQTPEILNEDAKGVATIYKSRSNGDILYKLFEEATENNPELKRISETYSSLPNQTEDLTENYTQYQKINANYWASAHQIIKQIKDTTLKEMAMARVAKSESEYNNLVRVHEDKLQQLKDQKDLLSDYYKLLQLEVTLPMIQNYQKNEIPETSELDSAIQGYGNLIEEINSFNHE